MPNEIVAELVESRYITAELQERPSQGVQALIDKIYLYNPDAANKLIEELNEFIEKLGHYGSYNSLSDKPVLDTTSSSALAAVADEIIQDTIKLHKISKTGSYSDLLSKPLFGALAFKNTIYNSDIADGAGITKNKLSSAVQATLDKADASVGAIEAEAQARQEADEQLQANIEEEATARENEDTKLKAQIDANAAAIQKTREDYAAADEALQEQINSSAGDISTLRTDLDDLGEQVSVIESKIPESASDTNQLVTTNQLTDESQDIRSEFIQTDSELQQQINAHATAITGLEDDVEAIESKIPTTASQENLLATTSQLNDAIQDVRADFASADTDLQTQITGQAAVISSIQGDVTDIESKMSPLASSENKLVSKSELSDVEQDIRSDMNTSDSELQTQITAQAEAITTLQTDLGDLGDQVVDNHNDIANHISDTSNPHSVTKSQVGLGNVDNTSDMNKPVSTSQQAAINSAISTEASNRDNAIKTAVEEEASARQSADTNLQSQITATNSEVAKKANIADLAEVATTGSYEDLIDTPDLSVYATDTELNSVSGRVTTIEGKIPTAATTTNQLADKAFVNSSINNLAAFYLTSNATGDAFATKAALVAGPYYFQGTTRTPTINDYAIVIADETKNNASTRYMYDGTQWDFQYVINDTPFTQDQVNAINSTATKEKIDSYSAHITNTSNPHGVTKSQVGLGNVDNTSDLNKPVSTATRTAIDAVSGALDEHVGDTDNPHSVTKAQVGLGNVNNTSDLNKPISTATQSALNLKANSSDVYLKSETYNQEEVDNKLDTKIDASVASSTYATITSLNAHINNKSNPHTVTKAQVGLGNVDNTSDLNKPVSTAQQNAINTAKQDVISGYTTADGELQQQINGQATAISTNTSNITALTTRVGTNETNIELLDSDVDTINTDLATAKTDITNLKSSVNSQAVLIQGLQDDVSEKVDKNQGTANAGKILSVGSDGRVALTSAPEGGLTAVAHDSTLTGTGANSSPLGIASTVLAEIADKADQTTVETLSGAVSQNTTNIGALRTDVDDLGDQVSGIEGKIPESTSTTNQLVNATQLATKADTTYVNEQLAGKQPIGDYATNSALTSGLALKVAIAQGSENAGKILKIDDNGNVIVADESGGGASLPILYHTWSDHLLNNISWLRADTFSWQSGDVYKSAYEHLYEDVVISWIKLNYLKYYRTPSDDVVINGTQYYAWTYLNTDVVRLTTSATPQPGDSVYNPDGTDSSYSFTDVGAEIKATQTDTIGDITITYVLADDGHKICLPDQESNISALYEATGVAWYFILDTENKQFKLPRTKYGFTGLRDSVGGYVAPGLPDHTHNTPYGKNDSGDHHAQGTSRPHISTDEYYSTIRGYSKPSTLASASNAIYGNSTTVQPPATQMYLYFYVGNYIEDLATIDAGKLTEIVNDFDIGAFKPEVDEVKNEAIVDISDAKTDAIDSLTNLATDLGSSLKYGNVGDIFYTSRLDVSLNGAVECNGNLYNTTDFSGAQSIGNLLRDSKVPYISLSEHQTTVDTYGSCRCFGWDGGTEFRVPKLTDVFIEAGVAASEGEFITAGLPNITGTFSGSKTASGGRSGAFYQVGAASGAYPSGTGTTGVVEGFNASRSSSIYGNSTTVQPPAVRYRAMVQLAFGATDDAVVTAGNVVADVSELNSHRVIAFQAPTADNSYTWYRKYADGWVEQGGLIVATSDAAYTKNLPITMSDNNYIVLLTRSSGTSDYGTGTINARWNEVWNATTVSFTTWGKYGGKDTIYWQVSGYAAS